MTPAPKVSVCMPVYNRGPLLPETLACILGQTFDDYELLVFDDGSTDDSAAIIGAIGDPRVRLIASERRGPPHPLNALYEEARGEYLIVLHDHDLSDPTLLDASVKALDTHPEAALVLQGSADVGLDGRSNYRVDLKAWPLLNDGDERLEAVLTADKAFASPFHACSMVRRSALSPVGPWYDPAFGLHADVDLWFRLLRGRKFAYLPQILLRFRAREPQGHILQGKELEVIDTMRAIFLASGRSCFGGTPARLMAFERHVSRMHARLERRLALRSFLQRPNAARHGFRRLSRNPAQPAVLRIISAAFTA